MSKSRLLWIVVLSVILSLSLSRPVYAYMDPGTAGNVFAMLAPFIAIFLAFLGFLIRPFRVFFASIITKLRGGSRAESVTSNEQVLSGDSSDDENSGENTSEEPKS